ncbi:hypothetical protein IFM89_007214 [Coptis chinensis]|uniref:RNase H type-1 domain-containing protein n=1 Tax=Coptis chinensis TaxID=261450 RepID=A0A835LDQ5_9MAGN|nr:hypothetical protein IFM89_007214 [Coptis chinensis]
MLKFAEDEDSTTAVRAEIAKVAISITWQFPPSGWLKLNTDGSALGCPGPAGAGGVLRNEYGGFIYGFATPFKRANAILMECYALRMGLLVAKKLELDHIIIEVDSSFLHKAIIGEKEESPSSVIALIEDIKQLLKGFRHTRMLPLLHWKKKPFLAAASIMAVRSLLIPVGFFVHFQKYVHLRLVVFPRSLIVGTPIMFAFAIVIALFKDLQDVEGDRKFGYPSFALQLGQEKVFRFCISLLLTAYGSAAVVGAFSPNTFCKLVTVLGQCTLGFMLWVRARSIDFTNKASLASTYKFIGQVS